MNFQKILKYLLVSFLALCLSSCAGQLSSRNATKCTTGKSKVKTKKFASKKKKVNRTVSARRSAPSAPQSSSRPAPPPPKPEPIVSAEVEEEDPFEEVVEQPVLIEEVEEVVEEPKEVIIEEIVPEPVVEEVVVEVISEPAPEPVVVPEPEPVVPEPEPEPVVVPEPEPEPVVVPEPEPEPQYTIEYIPDPEPEPTPPTPEDNPNTYELEGKQRSKFMKFSYDKFIEFIPNHDLFKDVAKERAKLVELANILKENPDLHVDIIGNAGWDNFDESRADEYDYQYFGLMNSQKQKIHYGKGPLVYDQVLRVSDDDWMFELMRRGEPMVNSVQIGAVMFARADAVRKELERMGVPKKQMSIKRGEFFKSDKRDTSFSLYRK